jgi:transcriptional regulator with XRE-family HTH domain
MTEAPTSGHPTNALGQHLASIRTARGYSLRQVEELTNKLVSNAYLSQIENNKIQKPSPNILHALARVYQTSYEQLMEFAGYIVGKQATDASPWARCHFCRIEPNRSRTNPFARIPKNDPLVEG